MEYKKIAQELVDYMNLATSPYHVVLESEKMLDEAGFEKLDISVSWNLKTGGAYYVNVYGTSLFAFTVGSQLAEAVDFRIAGAHTDHPCFKIKPKSEVTDNGYLKLDTDVYGGPILNTWLDRPLSIAGKVAIRSNDIFHPEIRLIDFKKPILTIPNLAIHMNREVNKGVELNKQSDTLPILGLINETLNDKNFFMDYLAEELGVQGKDILDFDLYIYNYEEGQFVGIKEEFISSPRIDNLSSCHGLLKGIINSKRDTGVNLITLFDNEEVGSRTKQGADSAILPMVLEKITAALGLNHEKYLNSIMKSMMLSVDVAHAIHPNRSEKSDPTNKVKLNQGVSLKLESNQKYATDSEAVAIVQQICDAHNVKYQKYVNRSDIAGGGTIGSIVSSWIPMKTVDMGVPVLAMHSARELMGVEDQMHLQKLMEAFFSL